MTAKEAIKHAEAIVEYCNEQNSCQNCIFRLYAPGRWKCLIYAFDIQDALSNYKAKMKKRGYI